jgi:hypothetical protein
MITEPRVQTMIGGGYAICQAHICDIHKIVTILAIYSPRFKKRNECEQWLTDNSGE